MSKKITFLLILLFYSCICYGSLFSPNATYDVCFTPSNNCADKIIKAITQAQQEILVQAYNFTDTNIAQALVGAKTRGVRVSIILDKSQVKAKYGLIPFFIKNNILPVIDVEPAIAHNKVIIIDGKTVIGGSYNLSKAAATKNAENVTIITDTSFAQEYTKYWYTRKNRSKNLTLIRDKKYGN